MFYFNCRIYTVAHPSRGVRADDKIPVDNPIEMAIMEGNEGIL